MCGEALMDKRFEYFSLDTDHFTLRLESVQVFTGDITASTGKEASHPIGDAISTEQLIQQSLPAVVQVDAGDASGSGFVISANGIVATNAHVVRDKQSVLVITSSGKILQSTNLYLDSDRDLALIKVSAENLPHLRISASLPVQGSDVVAIGTPGAHDVTGTVMLPNSVTKGIVSGIRQFSGDTVANVPGRIGTWIQTDATINHGNSGGPLLNKYGEVVGVNTLSFTATGTPGINFALAATELRQMTSSKLGVSLDSGIASEAKAQPSENGTLVVDSNPANADIEVDGALMGNTPSQFMVEPGSRSVRIPKRGFKAYERKILVQPKGQQRISVELETEIPKP